MDTVNDKSYYIYILRCTDNSLYTGITTDVKRRFEEHISGRYQGAKYTRSRKPVSIEALWQCCTRSDASKLECALKKLTKTQKEKLICENEFFENLFSDKLDISLYTFLENKRGEIV